MTTSAELNQARLSLQLQINQAAPQVGKLEFLVDDGAPWPEISQRWDTLSSNLARITSAITNLQQQNSGVPDSDPGKVALAAKLIENQRANSDLRTRTDQVKSAAVSNGNSDTTLNNLPAASAGAEVIEASDAAGEGSRFTTPSIGTETLVVLKDKDGNITGTDIIPADTVNPTNARLATLSGDFSNTIDTAPGAGVISTTGGGIEFPNRVSNPDDGVNSAGADNVAGRAAIASEFLQTITASPNRIAGLASQTYTISIYLMDIEEYDKLISSDRKTLPSRQLIMQSGGATIGERNKFFDLDFYPENIELKCMVGTQGVGSPHNAVTLNFDVLEPQGITFLERLRLAVWDHTGIPGATINGQNYLMVVRFYGYDENGNLVSGSAQNGGEPTSDPNAIVEKFIPFQIAMLRYKLAAQVVEYQLQCMIPQTTVGFSTARGSIPFNFQLDAPDVGTLFNGNMQLSASTIAANEFAAGDAQGGEFGTGNQKAGSSAP
ncbi:MAG: hypothetical protein ACKVJK_11900, partial [Methylophagaceae bacterium]